MQLQVAKQYFLMWNAGGLATGGIKIYGNWRMLEDAFVVPEKCSVVCRNIPRVLRRI